MRLAVDLRMVRHSGIGRYLRNVFPAMLPMLEVERVRVVAQRSLLGDASWLSDPRIEIFETSAPIYGLEEQALPLRGAYKDCDLLWTPHYNAPLWTSVKTVVTIHDIAPVALPHILSNPVKRAYARLLIERAVRHASAVICVSEFTRGELITRLGVPPEKLTVTLSGLDADWPASAKPHVEPDGKPYLLFVGNIKPNKNLRLLLQAFSDVSDRLPFRLLLVGKRSGFGSGDPEALQQAEALGDRVRLLGEVSDADLQRLYAGARALVFPSLYEGFGLPLLEAMQLGCVVLASSAGSLPEVGGEAALYFDPHSRASLADCLLQTLDPDAMSRLRRLGYERVLQFSFTRCAQQTAAVINRLLHEAK